MKKKKTRPFSIFPKAATGKIPIDAFPVPVSFEQACAVFDECKSAEDVSKPLDVYTVHISKEDALARRILFEQMAMRAAAMADRFNQSDNRLKPLKQADLKEAHALLADAKQLLTPSMKGLFEEFLDIKGNTSASIAITLRAIADVFAISAKLGLGNTWKRALEPNYDAS